MLEINTLCLTKKDEQYLKYLKSIKESVPVSTIKDIYDNNLKTFDEIKQKHPKHITNNFKIEKLCNIEIKLEKNLLPQYQCEENISAHEYLKRKCIDGLKKIFGQMKASALHGKERQISLLRTCWINIPFLMKNISSQMALGTARK